MKFLERGAVRVESRGSGKAPAQVAFRNPDGAVVLVVANPEKKRLPVTVLSQDHSCSLELPAESVATLRWKP